MNADTALVGQFGRAASQLNASLAACAGSTSSSCSSINANRSTAQALVAASTAFASGMAQLYTKEAFVPVVNTDAELAIEARIAAFKAQYQSFGVSAITGNAPFAAQARMTVTDAKKLLSDAAYGIAADPLQSVHHSHFGDVGLGGKLLLIDTFGGNADKRVAPTGVNFRFAVGGAVRFPTGQAENPDNFVDVGTGTGATEVEGRAFTDILLGRHFWQSAVVRLTHPIADEQSLRITDQPDLEIPELFRKQTVHRALGSTLEFETSPRWVLNDLLSISGHYVYRHKAQDHYTGTFSIPAAVTGYGDVALDASTLDLETEMTEQRYGGGIAFSNMYAYNQGKARIPFEVSFIHMQTTSGSGGNQPKYFIDQIQIRLYTRIFGPRPRPKTP